MQRPLVHRVVVAVIIFQITTMLTEEGKAGAVESSVSTGQWPRGTGIKEKLSSLVSELWSTAHIRLYIGHLCHRSELN